LRSVEVAFARGIDISYFRPLLAFVALCVFFWALHLLFPAIKSQRFVRNGFWTDCCYWLWAATVNRAQGPLAVGLLSALGGWVAGVDFATLRDGYGPLAAQPIALQIIEVFLIGDFLNYWEHRLRHSPLVWRFHAVHHSPRELDWLSAKRVHPIDNLVPLFLRTTPILLSGFAALPVALYLAASGYWPIVCHANLNWTLGPFSRVVVSPVFHRWHHTKSAEGNDKNFGGLFPFWDMLFGTFYLPAGRTPKAFGLDDSMPDDFLGQMMAPFRTQVRATPNTAFALQTSPQHPDQAKAHAEGVGVTSHRS
jgi:sterol desaturase/sphingolipid hydroxylase (fatty acid hydroxylase superfamily)